MNGPVRQRRAFLGVLASGFLYSAGAFGQSGAARVPTVGVLWHGRSADEEAVMIQALLQGFRELGYVEGSNIRFEHRFPAERPERFKSLAHELVQAKVDVIVACTTFSAIAAKEATASIPIVFLVVGDPIAAGLARSYAHPGGNATGLSVTGPDIDGKRLEILKEMFPGATRMAVVTNPAFPANVASLRVLAAAGKNKGVAIEPFEVTSASDFDRVFRTIRSGRFDAAIVLNSGLTFVEREAIAATALRYKVPTMSCFTESVEAGGLMSYAVNLRAQAQRAPWYVDRILKGARPADLPVEQPSVFETAVNLKTARALGVDIPATLRLRMDRVVE